MGLVENVHPFVLFTILTAACLLALYEDDSEERYEAVRWLGRMENIQNYAKNVQLVNVILFYVLLAFI